MNREISVDLSILLLYNIYISKILKGATIFMVSSKKEQLNKLEQLLLDAIDVDNLPAIERYEAAIADLKEEIKSNNGKEDKYNG